MTKNVRKTKTAGLAKPYEPAPDERAAVEAHLARKKVTPPAPRIMNVAQKDGVMSATLDHPDPSIGHVVLMEALGTVDPDFLDGLVGELAHAVMQGRTVDERILNFMLSLVKGVKPTDQVEAMLAAQMAAVHMATMMLARQLAQVKTLPQQDSAERAFNKLARTFAAVLRLITSSYFVGACTGRSAGFLTLEDAIEVAGRPRSTGAPPMALSAGATDVRDRPLPVAGFKWFGNRRLRGYSGADNGAAEMPNARGTEVCHCTL
jgi:hypothetical protein